MTMYFINQERMEEMGRLALQDAMLTHAMGGLLPERRNDFTGIHAVLDLACGSGAWCLSIARQHPTIQVMGIDLSEGMIEFNQAQARAEQLSNVTFAVMDVTKPLALPDASFDLVNARLLQGLMTTASWPPLLAEGMRLLRPGGVLRVTECERTISTSAAASQLAQLITEGMYRQGRTFSPSDMALTAVLGTLLRQQGLEGVQHTTYGLEYAYGTPLHAPITQNLVEATQLLFPYLTQLGLSTRKFNTLFRQMQKEIAAPDFCGMWYFATFTGKKPVSDKQEDM